MSEEAKKKVWWDSTLNFWSGCEKVSPGCANCYAEKLSKRNSKTFGQWGPTGKRKLHESAFKLALKLAKKPWVCDECGKAWSTFKLAGNMGKCPACGSESFHRRRVFSLSMGDWLDPKVPIEWLARMLDVIRRTPELDYLLVTKRPELWRERITMVMEAVKNRQINGCDSSYQWLSDWLHGNPPKNVWVIATVENQEMADKRIPELLKIPAVVHGLSCEPLLGPIDLGLNKINYDAMWHGPAATSPSIDNVSISGESGPKARSCNIEWIRSLKDQCQAAGVATFVKQIGASAFVEINPKNNAFSQRLPSLTNHPSGADPSEWPEDLRVQQWPRR